MALSPLALGPFEEWATWNYPEIYLEWQLYASHIMDFDEYAERNTDLIEKYLTEHPEHRL